MPTIRYIIGALCCYVRCRHRYGAWRYGMGPHGYYTRFRTCVYCDWVEVL